MQRSLAVLLALTASAFALTSCSSAAQPSPGASESPGELTTVTLGTMAIASSAPFVLAQKEGIFEENGIDLQIEFVEAAALVPGLLSGQYDFALSNAPAVIAARANAVPIKSVVTIALTPDDPADSPIQLVVPSGSSIDSVDDLVGKRVATDTLYQLPDLGMRGALLESGVDPAELEVIEIPFANMGAALQEGQVDAAVISEPFGTILRNAGAVTDLLSTTYGQAEGTPQTVLIGAEKLISDDPELVAQFQKAVNEAVEYAAAHEADLRAILPTFTKLDDELAQSIRFLPQSTEDSVEGWQGWADILIESGVIEGPVNVEDAFVPQKG